MKPTRFLSTAERRVYNVLQAAALGGHPCPSNTSLAKSCGMNSKDIARHINRMQDKGWLSLESDRNVQRTIVLTMVGRSITGPVRSEDHALKCKQREPRLEHRPPPRDPCFLCQVPYDRHDEHGCKTWKGMS